MLCSMGTNLTITVDILFYEKKLKISPLKVFIWVFSRKFINFLICVLLFFFNYTEIKKF